MAGSCLRWQDTRGRTLVKIAQTKTGNELPRSKVWLLLEVRRLVGALRATIGNRQLAMRMDVTIACNMDWTCLPTIESTRITLRRISTADVDALFEVFSNVEVMRYWSAPPLTDRDAAVDLVNEIHDSFERQVMLKWAVAKRANDSLIGTTTLYNLDFSNRRAELGYALGRAHWGQGYMQEALQALLGYAFETLDLRRLEADVDPRNKA